MKSHPVSLVFVSVAMLACGTAATATDPSGSGTATVSTGGGSSTGMGGAVGQGGSSQGGGSNSSSSSSNGGANQGGAGAGGMGGAAGGGGGTGGGGGSGPGGQGTPCTFGGAPCDPGFYCDAPGCGAGVCEPVLSIAAQTKDHAPVCGCNGVTFFNPSLAEVAGMAVSHGGVCTPQEGIPCTKIAGCAPGLHCNTEVANQASCVPVTQGAGFCWDVPVGCDPNGVVRGRGCINAVCADVCSLIQGQNPWHPDATCP